MRFHCDPQSTEELFDELKLELRDLASAVLFLECLYTCRKKKHALRTAPLWDNGVCRAADYIEEHALCIIDLCTLLKKRLCPPLN